jgi:8-oxo-dGTP pyrophosphatase MutT (NUDIX family)
MTNLIKRKPVLNTGFFTVYEDEVELKTGDKKIYYGAVRKPAVFIFPISKNNEIYLIDQYRYQHKKRLIEAVAGIIEDHEDPIDTAKKELKEEAGLIAKDWKEIGKTVNAGSFLIWNQYIYLARDLKQEKQLLEAGEDIKILKMSLEEAVKKVINGEIIQETAGFGILLVKYLIDNKKI